MINFGILSTAKIARQHVMPAIQNSENCQVTAICSRELENARLNAEKHGIKKYYGSYQELLEDPEINAVYNPLPNHMHIPWSISALKAGKHVLCEKPLGLSAPDVMPLLLESEKHPHLKIMEGFMYKHHPQWIKVLNMINSGEIGDIKSMQSLFAYYMDEPENVRNVPEYGGGVLMDLGCYCASFSRMIMNSEPNRVFANWRLDPEFGTDNFIKGIMEFNDVISTFSCTTLVDTRQYVEITGSEGSLELEVPFNPVNHKPAMVKLTRQQSTQIIQIPMSDQFTMMVDDFSRCITEDKPVPWSLEDSHKNMLVLDALKQSAETNETVNLGSESGVKG